MFSAGKPSLAMFLTSFPTVKRLMFERGEMLHASRTAASELDEDSTRNGFPEI
jgi:hypothetical protein